MSVNVKYKGATIQSITGTTTKTLKTSGKYCEGDIVLENTKDTPSLQSKTLTLGASAPSNVTPDSGKDGLSQVAVALDTSVIKAENIAKDVTMLGITGTHEGGGGVITATITGNLDSSGASGVQFFLAAPNVSRTDCHFPGFSSYQIPLPRGIEITTTADLFGEPPAGTNKIYFNGELVASKYINQAIYTFTANSNITFTATPSDGSATVVSITTDA